MQKISSINAIQVFDSRGVPTISCKVVLDDGISASAMVPSGASTGSKEALELRDNDVSYNGKSVSKAVSNINDILSSLVIGKDPNNQKEIDESLILFDNTKDKSKFGANAILAISLAVAHVAAKANKISLYEHFSKVYKDITGDDVTHCMPLPMFNILNGGEHADNNIDIQEFMIIPSGAKNFVEVMQWATEIYHNLKKILLLNNHSTAVGDEGGFAPSLESNKEALKLLKQKLEELDMRINKSSDMNPQDSLERFGDSFFSTIQSTFMPVNVPNLREDYILGIGDKLSIQMVGERSEISNGLTIARDGSLSIPDLGKVFLAGTKLSEAKSIINNYVQYKTFKK